LNDADVAWHASHGFPVMAYTATAFGYFGENPGKNAPHYENAISRGRRDRAARLGRELGDFSANQIALAFLRAHPFPAFPILGTMHPEHLADALGALAITLTEAQRTWLREG
jgi:aryl-alcohol dehydrogenase-like predicted oxidoreductase